MTEGGKRRTIVFCDFDGTISEDNTLVYVLYKYARNFDPEMERRLVKKELTLSEGIRYFMEHIPSCFYDEIAEYSAAIVPRAGLRELLEFLKGRGIDFVIISGGMAFMARQALRDYGDLISDIRAVEVDTAGEYFAIDAQYDDGYELVAKRRIAREYGDCRQICIGDGDTDFELVKDADVIFACGELAEHLTKQEIAFYRFEDFLDILRVLKETNLLERE